MISHSPTKNSSVTECNLDIDDPVGNVEYSYYMQVDRLSSRRCIRQQLDEYADKKLLESHSNPFSNYLDM